jgi:hypothetical protein
MVTMRITGAHQFSRAAKRQLFSFPSGLQPARNLSDENTTLPLRFTKGIA